MVCNIKNSNTKWDVSSINHKTTRLKKNNFKPNLPIRKILCKHSIKTPRIKIAQQWNFQIIKERWQDNQHQILITKIGQQTKTISSTKFTHILPSLTNLSPETQNNFYHLFNFQEEKELSIENFLITQIIILKSDDYTLLSDMFFYVYSSAANKGNLNDKDFYLFQKEFKQHQLDFQSAKKRPSKNQNGQISISKKSFREIFEQYDMQTIKTIFKFDLKEQQRRFQRYLATNSINRGAGKQVFLVQFTWFLKWKNYMEFKYGIEVVIKEDDKKLSQDKKNQLLIIQKSDQKLLSYSRRMAEQSQEGKSLDPINNQIIRGEQQNQLKQNLVQYEDFISVSKDVWKYFRILYGGGPAISKPYPHFYNKKIILTLYDHEKTKFQVNFAKAIIYNPKQTFEQIFKNRKQMYFKNQTSQNLVVYFKFPGKQDWTKIEKLNSKLQNFPFQFKTFIVYIRQNYSEEFEKKFNITVQNDKRQIKQRIKNYGNLLSFQYQGALQQAHVGNIYKNSVLLYLKNQIGQYVKIQRTYKSLQKLNPSTFQDNSLQGLAGLQNTGNTCYINSSVQCLLRAPYFGEYLESLNLGKQCQDMLFYQLKQIYQHSKRSRDCVDMADFKKKLDQKFQFFQGSAQHDAQQFLILLLDKLSQQIPQRNSLQSQTDISASNLKKGNKRILKLFSGKIQAQSQCLKCHNKGTSQQTFFTYSLSLPIINQISFYFYFIDSNFKAFRHCITIEKDAGMGYILQKIIVQLNFGEKNLFIMSVFQNQWMNNIKRMRSQHKITTLQNYQTNVVCYKINTSQDPEYEDFKQSKNNNSVKLQIRNRSYDQKLKSYKSFYFPFYIEVDRYMTGKQIKHSLNKKLISFVNQEQLIRFQNLKQDKNLKKSQVQDKIFISGDSNKVKQKLVDDKGFKSQKYNQPQKISGSSPFTISYIKNQTNGKSICWFCKRSKDTLKYESDQKNYCNGCEFQQNQIIYQNKNFIKNWENLVITIDWKSQTLTTNFKSTDTKSCQIAEKLQKQRRSNLQKLLNQSFSQQEQIQLRCERQKCKNQFAIRKQRIKQIPNVLILHIKRFEFKNGTFYKLKNKVQIPQKIIIPGFSKQYELFGNVVHYGSGSGRGGHYINYVKVNSNWFRCDDQKVHFTKKQNQHLNSDAYLLFYKLKQTNKNLGFLNF